MSTIKHHDNIYEITNFIDKKTIDFLLSKINMKDDDGWTVAYGVGNVVFFSYEEDFIECVEDINSKLLKYFRNVHDSTGIQNIRRLKNKEYMVAHKDFGDSGTNTSIVFGVVVYLNNDFNGGEIFYKDLNLKVKPTPGSLLVHTSDILHEVLPVTNGERYSISTFIKGDKETSFIFK
jgi:hypothetical protein